ncbi:MAG: hypothetical protein MdMp024_0031 [Bacteroidales bacterium]
MNNAEKSTRISAWTRQKAEWDGILPKARAQLVAMVKHLFQQGNPEVKFDENGNAEISFDEWFYWKSHGRGPGKQPPPERMNSYVERHNITFTNERGKTLPVKSAGFLIGRAIGRRGVQGTHEIDKKLDALDRIVGDYAEAIVSEQTFGKQLFPLIDNKIIFDP